MSFLMRTWNHLFSARAATPVPGRFVFIAKTVPRNPKRASGQRDYVVHSKFLKDHAMKPNDFPRGQRRHTAFQSVFRPTPMRFF